MENNFTIEDIKDSVESQWQKSQIKLCLYIWGIISILTLFVPLIGSISDFSLLPTGMLIWICWIFLIGLLFGIRILYYHHKVKYLLKNYKKFSCHEVVLDNFSTSILYKNSIFYSVKINEGNQEKIVNTNPYFSNFSLAKLLPSEYNGKKVLGLYDDSKDKFYIIKKVE